MKNCRSAVLILFVLMLPGMSAAQITNWQTGSTIPGTESVVPGVGVDLSNFSTEPGLSYADLSNANLRGANFQSSLLDFARFDGAAMRGAMLSDTIGTSVNFNSATLTNAVISGASLTGSSFDNVNFTDSNVTANDFQGASFVDSDLTRANIAGSNLTDAVVVGVRFDDTIVEAEQIYSMRPPATRIETCETLFFLITISRVGTSPIRILPEAIFVLQT